MINIIKMRPPRLAAVFLLFCWALHHFSPEKTIAHLPLPLLGTLAMFSGFAIMIRAWWFFKQMKTPICPTATPQVLVTWGPFRFSRNPIYLGMLLMLMASTFFMGTLPAVFAPLAFFVTIDRFFIPYEERNLEQQFGQQYLNYTRDVRQWI